MTATWKGLSLDGQPIAFDVLSYDMPRFDPIPGAAGFTGRQVLRRSESEDDDTRRGGGAAMSRLRALFEDEAHPRSTRIQWDHGCLCLTFDVTCSDDAPALATELSMSLDFVPGGLASVACSCCDQGRAYGSARAAFQALRGRWKRHVCPRKPWPPKRGAR